MKWVIYGFFGLIGIALWATAGGIGREVGHKAVKTYEQTQTAGFIEQAQANAAAELNRRLPIKVDADTTLMKAEPAGITLIYHYKLSFSKAEIDPSFFSQTFSNEIQKKVCLQKPMRLVLNKGGKYLYSYKDKFGEYIGEIVVGESDC